MTGKFLSFLLWGGQGTMELDLPSAPAPHSSQQPHLWTAQALGTKTLRGG